MALTFWFSKQGFDVKTFDNGREMLEALLNAKPNLVLLDVNLRGEDGREICSIIKKQMKINIPVILFSANSTVASEIKSFGADDFISKPFDLSFITKKVNQLLSK